MIQGPGLTFEQAPIPLVDLKAAHEQVAAEVEQGIASVISRTAFVGGPEVTDFEQAYAEYIGVAHAVGVANGTDALEIALRALGVGPGDEVIVPANTFIATAEAIVRCGAVPTYSDVTPDALMDPEAIGAAITSRTVGIIPVHLYGQMPDMAAIAAIADRRGLFVLEDAAQAQGARQEGRSAGTFGIATATSFYPGKNLGAYGDAGAVLTNDDSVARRCRLLGAHGSTTRYVHETLGFNSRLDTIQAVVLRAKLRHLSASNALRRAAASHYDELLESMPGVVTPRAVPGNEHVWHLYVIQTDNRDQALRHLNSRGIGAGLHYPVPVHLTPALATERYPKGSLPMAERLAARILSLPIYPQITREQQARVVRELAQHLNEDA